MLGDQEIERNAKQLAEYKKNDALPDILERYANLIEDYKRLKSDYEEEREGRERYKQMARGQERNPFVLVLVDGDGYVFEDDLVRDGTEGGSRAAKRLNDMVKHSLRRKGLEHCEVMVRVYANLVGLSKTLYKAGLCGPEKRSLAPFTAGFNRSYGLNDFVDAGELKENADFKLRAMLRLYAENSQCKHIYFAACHDVGYIAELTPYRGNRERFTLVSTTSLQFHSEFQRLAMNIEELPTVFRTIPLDSTSTYYRPGGPPSGPNNKSPAVATQSPIVLPVQTNDGQKICQFYQIGKCKYGKGCKNQHVDARQQQQQQQQQQPSVPFHMSRASRSDSDFGGSNFGGSNFGSGRTGTAAVELPATTNIRDSSTRDRDGAVSDSSSTTHKNNNNNSNSNSNSNNSNYNDFSLLPKSDEIPRGCVALNPTDHRLDAYIPAPTGEAQARLKARSERRKLCNTRHLTGSCDNEHCEYDHSPLPDELRPALELWSRSMPCPKRGVCRNAGCVYGHVCQRADCKHRGGKVFCRFPYLAHFENLTFDSVVPGWPKKSQSQSHSQSHSQSQSQSQPQPQSQPPPQLSPTGGSGGGNGADLGPDYNHNHNHNDKSDRRSPSTDDDDDDPYHRPTTTDGESEEGAPIMSSTANRELRYNFGELDELD
ncbi:hypothetical protein SLS62_001096 [Diatrype stigma]|uniref:C3H1-type domain-containing protein n=1 Tax=Diatrype stigma TaxID=117547 RepID=A0AAN9UZA3_9PEZI